MMGYRTNWSLLFFSGMWVFLTSLVSPVHALELNEATRAQLEALPDVGVESAARIIEARDAAPFMDWSDFMRRVKGFKQKRTVRLAALGVTVAGLGFDGVERPLAPLASPGEQVR